MRAVSVLLPELASRLELMRLPLKRAFWGAQIWDRNCSVVVRLPLLHEMDNREVSTHAAACQAVSFQHTSISLCWGSQLPISGHRGLLF